MSTQKFSSKGLPVDSWMIWVLPFSSFSKYIDSKSVKKEQLKKDNIFITSLQAWEYKCFLEILETREWDVFKDWTVIAWENDTVYVWDPCYIIKDELWDEFLEQYVFSNKWWDFLYTDSMGWDWTYPTNITISGK